ncbi:hypothetical protein M8J77_014460 [Diaphorina citri]|nr:hypothetical protein M8J77_014460 [Diaphorina citri]
MNGCDLNEEEVEEEMEDEEEVEEEEDVQKRTDSREIRRGHLRSKLSLSDVPSMLCALIKRAGRRANVKSSKRRPAYINTKQNSSFFGIFSSTSPTSI